MKKNILIVGFLILAVQLFSQCYAPTSLSAPNIYFHSAEVSWAPVSSADYFRIRYKRGKCYILVVCKQYRKYLTLRF